VVIYVVLALAIVLAGAAMWRTFGVQKDAIDLGKQVSTACTLDRADAERKGLNCGQAQAVAGSPAVITPPVQTTLVPVPVPVPGAPFVVTQTNQVPLPLPTIVPLPGATNTIISPTVIRQTNTEVIMTPGPTVTQTITEPAPPPQTVTETQTQTQTQTTTETQTQTVTMTCTPDLLGRC
jgi:hypothetical protein